MATAAPARTALLLSDGDPLGEVAGQLGRRGWTFLRQDFSALDPQRWPPVGMIELRHAEQCQRLEPLLTRLLHGHYLALVDNASLRSERTRSLIANGFQDYLTLPCSADFLDTVLAHALGMSALSPQPPQDHGLLLGESSTLAAIREQARLYGQCDLPVLIQGESGSGKECAARLIHQHSGRKNGPFVAVNCASIPGALFTAELFGNEKTPDIDTNQVRKGRIAEAAGGTLFLDEVGEMKLSCQTALLSFLESGTYYPLGSNHEQHNQARILCATNHSLEDDVQAGRFRLDLYHRINVLQLSLPPLREHADDIALLAKTLLRDLGSTASLSHAAMDALMQHDFPGNVRELRNCLCRAAVLCHHGVIEPQHLGLKLREATPSDGADTVQPLARFRQDQERRYLAQCLSRYQGNIDKAAEILDISRSSLYRLINKYGLNSDRSATSRR